MRLTLKILLENLSEDFSEKLTTEQLATEEPAEASAAPEPVAEDAATTSTPLAAQFGRRGVFEDDWRARPTDDHPWPVILIHGPGHAKGVWEQLGTELREQGWATFAPDYGYRATSALSDSLDQLQAYIDTVLKITGARRAILIGHSQGGLLATLLSFRLPEQIKHVVCLAAPNHGTSLGGIAKGLTKIPGTRA